MKKNELLILDCSMGDSSEGTDFQRVSAWGQKGGFSRVFRQRSPGDELLLIIQVDKLQR